MIEPGPIVRRQRVDIIEADAPNPAKLGVFAELFCHIAQSARCCIRRRELGHPSTAVHLHGQIPERCNYREGTNQLCTSINRFPAHRGLNVLSARPRSTGRLPCALGNATGNRQMRWELVCLCGSYFVALATFSTSLPRVCCDAICSCALATSTRGVTPETIGVIFPSSINFASSCNIVASGWAMNPAPRITCLSSSAGSGCPVIDTIIPPFFTTAYDRAMVSPRTPFKTTSTSLTTSSNFVVV